MTAADTTAITELDEMGPVDYLVIEFPDAGLRGEAMPLLLDLVDRGVIRIIDLEFISRDTDGAVVRLAVEDLGADGDPTLSLFVGASSGLLAGDDLEEAAGVLEPGTTAAILVYENLWAAPLARAVRRTGAQFVAGGRIPVQALLAALDAAESAD
ncbi:MAG TPA: DUF6325 family protein [Amycolatopsis sp.]|nr:DUF6325 family protein [Amycolatopsis sp.]